ncbi:MAG TPA: Nif3-like dinuclear metal center hexameric protein [Bacilli bacterium]
MFAKGQTVIQLFELFAPKRLALPDDKIGLQLGTLHKNIKKVMVALDVTIEVVEEAIGQQADLIIAHHAIIYRPLTGLNTDTVEGRLYEMLIKHDIAVYIAHTNLDVAEGGINDMMAAALNLTDIRILCPTDVLNGKDQGIGRVGKLTLPMDLKLLSEEVKTVFKVPMVRVVGDLKRQIRKVAVLGGAGGKYVKHALFAGADVLITGDMDYHTAQEAKAAGLAIIDPGHNIEKIMKEQTADYLRSALQGKKYETKVISSLINTEPFVFI